MHGFLHASRRPELASSSLCGKHFPNSLLLTRLYCLLASCFISPLVRLQITLPINLRTIERGYGRDRGRVNHSVLRLQCSVLSCTSGVLSLASILDWLVHCCGDSYCHVALV